MVYAAAVTPFSADGQIDQPGVVRLVAWLKANECDGVVLGGTTGEGPSLSAVEKRDLVRLGCAHSMGLKIILGVATNSLPEAQWLVRQAVSAGAHGVLVMPPSFYRDYGQAGIIDWFEQLLDSSEIPIFLYNFPKRVGIAIEPETLARLAQHPQMAGLKDSSGSVENLALFADAAPGKALFCGDETLVLLAHEQGWAGTISGAANVCSRWLKEVDVKLVAEPEAAKTKLEFLRPILSKLKSFPQPWTHKSILARFGVLDETTVRPPLRPEAPLVWSKEFEILA